MAQNPRPPVRPAPAPLAPPSTPPLPEESDEAESFWDKLFREPPTPRQAKSITMADRVAETKKSIADAFKKPKSKDDKRDSMWDSFLSDAPAPLGKTITESVKRERKRAGVDE